MEQSAGCCSHRFRVVHVDPMTAHHHQIRSSGGGSTDESARVPGIAHPGEEDHEARAFDSLERDVNPCDRRGDRLRCDGVENPAENACLHLDQLGPARGARLGQPTFVGTRGVSVEEDGFDVRPRSPGFLDDLGALEDEHSGFLPCGPLPGQAT